MRRMLFTFVALLLFLYSSHNTSAATILKHIEHLKNDPVSEEVLPLADEAKEAISTVYQENTGQSLPEDTEINLGDAYKLYIADFLFQDLEAGDSLQDYLATVPVLWYYELPIDDSIYILEITLTDQTWQVSSSGYSDGPMQTYAEKLSRIDDTLVGDEPVYLVGGLKLIQYPVTIITRSDYPESLVSINGVQIIDSAKDEVYNDPTQENYVSDKNPLEYAEGAFGEEVIDFQAMQELANSVELDDKVGVSIDLALLSESTENNPISITGLIWTLGIGTVAVILFFLLRKKRLS